MKSNMGGIDKKLRITAGLIIVGLGVAFQSWWGAIGIVPIATGLINFCPAYVPFKFSTKKE